MKLLRARIENFRLLKEIEFEFATSADKNLTVIRAANESGKTTLLTALQWGLFGDDALPEGGSNFRLSPIDASANDRATVAISVEIDYEVLERAGGQRKYRLIRSLTETVQGSEFSRGRPSVRLFHLSTNGARPVENPEAHIQPYLPKELREVFFTDGDRALNFIQGSSTDQMKRVEGAIRSLLGFSVIEDALKHVGTVNSNINKKVRKESGNKNELNSATQKLSDLQEEIPKLEEQFHQAKEARDNLEFHEKEADVKLSEALRKGNREDLEKQKKAATQARLTAEKDADQATSDHANLFKSELLGKQLLASPFQKARAILEDLRNQGKIPNQTVPVLEERLNQLVCICGEKLDGKTSDGKKRRKHVQRLIEDSRNADEIQEKITALFFSAQDLLNPVEGRGWTDEYSDVFGRRQRANKQRQEQGGIERETEAHISQLPDIDIQQLSVTRDRFREQAMNERNKEIRFKTQIEAKLRERALAEQEREKLLQQDEKGREFNSELQVAKDLQDVMKNALETMKTRELKQVGKRMNTLFLDMIGVDDDQRAIITRAEITPEFQIVVFGRHEVWLNPSRDLNGASRRALTIAFILALTKISEVEAPNVIDTPLGMTAGYVKTAILQLASQQSSQLILFLTHDEIKGCEDILDKYAGKIYTLTNPAHYPKILINDPCIQGTQVLLCKCNHHKHCEICERRTIIDTEFDSN